MRAVSFPYRPGKDGVLRPTVDVWLTSLNRRTIRSVAMVDSGADVCTFPLSAAVLLGLDCTRMQRRLMIGLGVEPSVSYLDVVTIDLGEDVLFQTEVSFTEGLNAIGMGLPGQKGLFDHFDVSFQLRRGVFTIG